METLASLQTNLRQALRRHKICVERLSNPSKSDPQLQSVDDLNMQCELKLIKDEILEIMDKQKMILKTVDPKESDKSIQKTKSESSVLVDKFRTSTMRKDLLKSSRTAKSCVRKNVEKFLFLSMLDMAPTEVAAELKRKGQDTSNTSSELETVSKPRRRRLISRRNHNNTRSTSPCSGGSLNTSGSTSSIKSSADEPCSKIEFCCAICRSIDTMLWLDQESTNQRPLFCHKCQSNYNMHTSSEVSSDLNGL